MIAYAIVSLLSAAAALGGAFIAPQFRRTCVMLAAAFAVVAMMLFGIDCAISCVRTGELYVPQR